MDKRNVLEETLDSNLNYQPNLQGRYRNARIWDVVFKISTLVGIIALVALLLNVVNGAFGYVAFENSVSPSDLSRDGIVLDDMDAAMLTEVFRENVSAGLFRRFDIDKSFPSRTRGEIYNLIFEWVVQPVVVDQWTLGESIVNKKQINVVVSTDYPNAELDFKSWIDLAFITSPQDADALRAGVRTAILGSLWVVSIALLFAFPIGVGAAIYLEEYARKDNLLNRIIETNINNLAGVPSIIYGILGLAIFVRALEPITSGKAFGVVDPTTASGRTVLSAGLTLGLLVLPLMIINARESIKAVSNSLRLASFGLGATRWQTVWSHVLPNSMSGILTGTILAVSRAVGETAPLVVVGASTYINVDPSGPFSKFTTLPIQIYQWTSRPQDVYRNIAAAAILVLLLLLFSLNSTAIILRNRFSRRN